MDAFARSRVSKTWPRLVLILVALFAEISLPAGAIAAYALVVGSNVGGPGQTELHYAEDDARKVGAILAELGGYPRDSIDVVVHPTPALWPHDPEIAAFAIAERSAAEKEKRPFRYSRKWMAETAAQRARFEAEGRKPVVRLKMPRDGACRFFDHIRGDMAIDWAQEQDHVIQRADGTCLYNLANVVDDFDMQITHVIRAEEHLSNTPRQIFIARENLQARVA